MIEIIITAASFTIAGFFLGALYFHKRFDKAKMFRIKLMVELKGDPEKLGELDFFVSFKNILFSFKPLKINRWFTDYEAFYFFEIESHK